MDLNEYIDKTHFDYEQNETKAKQLEDRILKVLEMTAKLICTLENAMYRAMREKIFCSCK